MRASGDTLFDRGLGRFLLPPLHAEHLDPVSSVEIGCSGLILGVVVLELDGLGW